MLVVAASCATPTPPDAAPIATNTAAVATPTATPDLKLPTAATAAAAFVDAINQQDYLAAFTLLDDESRQTLKDADGLRRQYVTARQTALANKIVAQLRGGLLQQGEQAGATLVTNWQSDLVGAFDVTSTLPLVYSDGASEWRVAWTPDVIVPGLADGVLAMERSPMNRGSISAADGTLLATQVELTTLGVQRGLISDATVEQALLALLSEITQLPPDEVKAKYAEQPEDWFSPIADVEEEVLASFSARLAQFPAVSARKRFTRTYLQPELAPHVTGFVGFIPPERLEEFRARGFAGDERIGLVGVEAGADDILGGTPGGELKLISNGQITVLAKRDAVRGQDITLTLSPMLQVRVQDLLGDRRGAAVVLSANDSGVLAMASSPTYSITNVTDQAIQQGALLNRATQGQYPPGSTFKMVTMAAGVGEGVTQPDDVFSDPGFWDGYGSDFRKTCWLKSGHGRITLQNGLTASCNIVFYETGKRLEEKGSFVLPGYARQFGFGARTSVELPEAAGIVPDPDWKKENIGEAWTGGDTVNMSVGQGFMLVTPLQIAQMTAAIANGGALNHAHLVASPRDPADALTERLPASAATLDAIQQGMIGVTTNARYGTTTYRFSGFDYCFNADNAVVRCSALPAAQRRNARRLVVAGKSGTAQAAGEQKPFAWFTAYVPADDPEIVVTALLENIGEGSSYAAPLVRQIIESYYGLPVSPTPTDRRDNE